jgi:hypothetical protein
MVALDDDAATASIAELNDKVTNTQFTQDVPIWENKMYRERPPLTHVDGPIVQYRRWFRQFYSGWTSPGNNARSIRASTEFAEPEQIPSG